jgi:predicted Zn-dependent protease
MFESIVRVQPDNVRARVGWANQLGAAGRDAEALEQLALAEQKDPQLSEIAASRAVIYFRHGDWPKVHENASRALALDPTNPQARLLEATALMRMRRLDEASTLLQRLMAEQPGNPAIEGIWGQVLLLRGDPAGAVPFLTRAAAWENDDASVTYALGMACQLTEQWSQARDAFAQTVRLDPTYLEGWIRLARAAHRAQDPATLDRALTTARELPGGEQAVAELRKELGRSP